MVRGLTRDDILAMKPGRLLDKIVAFEVMNWPEEGPIPIPRYSTHIAAAWEVVVFLDTHGRVGDKWVGGGTNVNIQNFRGGWAVEVGRSDAGAYGYAQAATAPEAICKAALLTVLDV